MLQSTFEPLPASAQEEAYRHILHGIRMGEMRPGDRLVPEELAAALGMSRMPVREACSRLAAEGLLVMRPNRGVVVRGLTEKEVSEVFEMRAVLEGLAASRAAERVTDADIRDLEQLLARMAACEPSLSDWITVHRQFHERFCAIADAPRLTHQISSLHSAVEPLMRIWLENSPSSGKVQAVHEALVAALKAGDPARMEALMRAHVRGTTTSITEAMRKGDEAPATA